MSYNTGNCGCLTLNGHVDDLKCDKATNQDNTKYVMYVNLYNLQSPFYFMLQSVT